MSTARDTTINRIAREALGLETLETRRADSLDFHDLAVWTIKDALERAYEAGRDAALPRTPIRTTCPACNRDIEIRPLPPLT
ncbi:MAG: hypothetical protein JJU33_09390 [Phycisphaerales bacterium]|nr:hypothetical protein [Phycisphaerales bacterium]